MTTTNTTKIDAREILETIIRHDRSVAVGGAYIIGAGGFEQLRAGQGPGLEYYRGKLAHEVPATVVARALVVAMPAGRCEGGWVRGLSWDSEYPCGGCARCNNAGARIGFGVSAFVWQAATLATREALAAGVAAMHALASIGAAVQAALSPGAGVGSLVAFATAAWNEVIKGRWYRVAGKRGRAAEHAGLVGRAAWVGESTYGGYYDRRAGRVGGRTSLRVGLAVEGREGLVYVGAGQVEPIVEPAPARAARIEAEAAKAERAKQHVDTFRGGRGTFAYVVAGEHRGKSGAVVFNGPTRRGERVAIAPGVSKLPRGRYDGPVVWCAPVEVAADMPAECGTELQIHVEIWILGALAILQWALDAADVPVMERALGMLDLRPGNQKPRARRKPRAAFSLA